ncbi:MAG: hypothetical protein PUC47_01260 [Oscillospiraceae bacterium]|nr:hypothetical protein [Oscillospiraceae bacterium]
MYTFQSGRCRVTFEQTGRISSLRDLEHADCDWTGGESLSFGEPFINGTQETERLLPCTAEYESENEICFVSASGGTRLVWSILPDGLALSYKTVPDCGPRMGVNLDLNLLDLVNGTPWQEQCMPTTIYTSPDCSYAYFIFSTSSKRCLALCVCSDFAAWRIKYSYEGHRMTGFQILSQADDVICDERPPLKAVSELHIQMAFCDSPEQAFQRISDILDISIAMPEIAGGFPESEIPFRFYGAPAQCTAIQPDGTEKLLDGSRIVLTQTGEYKVKTIGSKGRVHLSSVLCQKEWEALYSTVNHFYASHFQHPCGAFSRVIWKDTLSPKDGFTFEGVAFGDPFKPVSCRTGEFGGFCAWAMIRGCQLFGKDPVLMDSIDRYINGWALNRDKAVPAYPGTVIKEPTSFQGRDFTPYHLYREFNYPQQEVFLLEQFADYYDLTGDARILEDLEGLALHFIHDHMRGDGCVICQNSADGIQVDYCTVHTPITGLIRAMEVLKSGGHAAAAETIRQAALRLADYICDRGFGFPTEGEPCTEDGSMACIAVSLFRAYLHLQPKAAYLEVAEKILDAHSMLEMTAPDCRMNGSSIRFWETQYESRDWGPSINAGHGWTIWMAEAKLLQAVITEDFDLLAEAYNGFLCNIRRVDDCGGMPSSFTPDMIPGTPHGHGFYLEDGYKGGDFADMRPTSTHLGMRYVAKTYSASGNYFLIRAGQFFSHISGLSAEKGIAVNGVWKNGVFTSHAVQFDTLILQTPLTKPVRIEASVPVQLIAKDEVTIVQGVLQNKEKNTLLIQPVDGQIVLQ